MVAITILEEATINTEAEEVLQKKVETINKIDRKEISDSMTRGSITTGREVDTAVTSIEVTMEANEVEVTTTDEDRSDMAPVLPMSLAKTLAHTTSSTSNVADLTEEEAMVVEPEVVDMVAEIEVTTSNHLVATNNLVECQIGTEAEAAANERTTAVHEI